jgi:Rod binding domain-containing protein
MGPTIPPPVGSPEQTFASASPRKQSASKLEQSAREFESILLQSWLEKMNQSFVGASASQDPAHDTVSSLGSQAIASALAARGGIGIAAMLLRHLQAPMGIEETSERQNFALFGTGLPKAPSR